MRLKIDEKRAEQKAKRAAAKVAAQGKEVSNDEGQSDDDDEDSEDPGSDDGQLDGSQEPLPIVNESEDGGIEVQSAGSSSIKWKINLRTFIEAAKDHYWKKILTRENRVTVMM